MPDTSEEDYNPLKRKGVKKGRLSEKARALELTDHYVEGSRKNVHTTVSGLDNFQCPRRPHNRRVYLLHLSAYSKTQNACGSVSQNLFQKSIEHGKNNLSTQKALVHALIYKL